MRPGADSVASVAPASGALTAPDVVAPAGPSWRPGYVRPPVIDIHGHIMPSGLARLATVMEENGLALMTNLSGGSHGKGLEVSVKVQQVFPRMIHFYTPNWRLRKAPRFGELEAAKLEDAVKKRGFRGLKIAKALGLYLTHPDGSRVPVDWPELDPLWAMAGTLGVPVAIHTSDPKAFWDPVTPENERYDELNVHPSWSFHGPEYPSREQLLAERDRMIARHPGTTFICVHFGNNPEDIDAVDRLLDTHPNVVIDTSARVAEIGRHAPEKVRAFFAKHKTRVLFGTDIGLGKRGIMLGSTGDEPPKMSDVRPFYDAHWRYFEGTETQIAHPVPIQGKWKIDAAGLSEDILAHLYYKNALRVLQLPQSVLTTGQMPALPSLAVPEPAPPEPVPK